MLRILTAVSLGLAFTAAALAQETPAKGEFRQAPALLARYADVPVTLRSPFFAAGRARGYDPGREAAGFTTQAEMEAFIAALGNAANLGIGSLGRSLEGRNIPYLLFTAEGARSLEEAARNQPADRPVVWLIGQHHGNEPAGGEAMLALAKDIASGGELAELTRALTIVIVPRSNPDGAAAFTRDTAAKADPNRDHLLLTLPETRVLQTAAATLPPDLVIDAHEFTVGGRWLAKFEALHATDFVYMRATHPLVPARATALADQLFLPAIEAAAASAGLTAYVYQTSPNARPEDKTVATGGNAAGIARNAFGLMGAVSILLETRGVGIGTQGFQRRVATHYLAAIGALRAAAADPARLRRAVAEGRQEAARSHADLVVAHRVPVVQGFVPLVDPVTAAPRPTSVPFVDARHIEPTVVRPRPAGYWLADGEATAPVREALARRGIRSCILTVPATVSGAEAFTVTARRQVDRRAINPEGGVSTKAERDAAPVTLPAGSSYVPVEQPLVGLVVASLDPDAAGGFVSAGLFPGEVGARLPLLRLPAGAGAIGCPARPN
ncbi:M14 family zinc carboxypeptidase [Bosea sp. LjRoot9]|uniref:M14 family zinc carboxypeptidase n=1 Tax=Bosea sp. LjRoot9 TaxID=3342341 RepID=UPI003ECFD49A